MSKPILYTVYYKIILWGNLAMKALLITANLFEDLELFYPLYRLAEAGVEVDVASGDVELLKGKHGYQIRSNVAFSSAKSGDYSLLLLPGGRAPQTVRKNEQALRLVREFFDQDKLVAAICHGPQILISAGLVAGRNMTSFIKVQPELAEAGAQVQDKPVVVDGKLITSREPSDLPFFLREIIKAIGSTAAF